MVYVVNDEVFWGVCDLPVHVNLFAVFITDGVEGSACFYGGPAIFGEFGVVGGVDVGDLAIGEGDEVVSGSEGGCVDEVLIKEASFAS